MQIAHFASGALFNGESFGRCACSFPCPSEFFALYSAAESSDHTSSARNRGLLRRHALCTEDIVKQTHARSFDIHKALNGMVREEENLTAQFKLNRRSWNLWIRQASCVKSWFGVPAKRPPISIPRLTAATPSARMDGKLEPGGNGHAWICALRRRPAQARPRALNFPGVPVESNFMYLIELICRTSINLVKQVWRLPQTIALALEQRRRQLARNEFETERLDRIRNPAKYAGR